VAYIGSAVGVGDDHLVAQFFEATGHHSLSVEGLDQDAGAWTAPNTSASRSGRVRDAALEKLAVVGEAAEFGGAEEGLASLSTPGSNQIAAWLRSMDLLRSALGAKPRWEAPAARS